MSYLKNYNAEPAAGPGPGPGRRCSFRLRARLGSGAARRNCSSYVLRIWSFTNILACVERSLPWLSQQPAHIVVPLSQGGQLIVQTDGYVAGWGAFARGLEGFVPKLWEDRMQNSQYDVNLRSSIDNAQVRDVLAYCFMVGTGCGCGGAWSRTRSEREGGGLGGRTPVRRGPGTPGDPGGRGPGPPEH